MSYIVPSEFVTKMVDAGESKIYMATRDTLIRAFMAGGILSLAAVFAVTVTVQTGSAILGAALFPVGFCILYLMGFDLLTGVFVLTPLALFERRPGVRRGSTTASRADTDRSFASGRCSVARAGSPSSGFATSQTRLLRQGGRPAAPG